MASATLTYKPSNDSWSSDNQPIHVYPPGTTTITWSIQLADNESGSIAFDTATDSPGIEFGSDWVGTRPTGTATSWSADLTDNEVVGDDPIDFKYTVNALYTPPGGSAVKKSWDPDVEEDPPPPVTFHPNVQSV